MSFNVTIALADQYAAAKAAADAAVEALDALKAQIKAAGLERHIGVTCDVVLALSEQKRVDNALLKQFLTEDQIEACKKPVLVERITIKAKGIK
jgi:enamine deaminase RidA (YjgF/YER057c/UK114 family)